MSSLREQIDAALKDAMRSKDSVRTGALRLVRAAVRNAEIDSGSELDDSGIQKILGREIKQRRESASAYRQGNREDLAEAEDREAAILKEFVPAGPSDEQIAKAVDQAIAALGATTMADMGPVMRMVMDELGGGADGRVISQQVRGKLGGQ